MLTIISGTYYFLRDWSMKLTSYASGLYPVGVLVSLGLGDVAFSEELTESGCLPVREWLTQGVAHTFRLTAQPVHLGVGDRHNTAGRLQAIVYLPQEKRVVIVVLVILWTANAAIIWTTMW